MNEPIVPTIDADRRGSGSTRRDKIGIDGSLAADKNSGENDNHPFIAPGGIPDRGYTQIGDCLCASRLKFLPLCQSLKRAYSKRDTYYLLGHPRSEFPPGAMEIIKKSGPSRAALH